MRVTVMVCVIKIIYGITLFLHSAIALSILFYRRSFTFICSYVLTTSGRIASLPTSFYKVREAFSWLEVALQSHTG